MNNTQATFPTPLSNNKTDISAVLLDHFNGLRTSHQLFHNELIVLGVKAHNLALLLAVFLHVLNHLLVNERVPRQRVVKNVSLLLYLAHSEVVRSFCYE
jgi:hypothetical protein